jgi:hypothetical protein
MPSPEWELGYNQGYAAGFDDGFAKGQREGRFLGFNDGFWAALVESRAGDATDRLPQKLGAMNRAGLFRMVLSGPAAHAAAAYFRALGFRPDSL